MIKTVKTAILICLCFFTYNLRGQKISLLKTDVGDEIVMLVPGEFIPMDAQDIRSKFISYREPKAGFTSEDRSVDLVVNINSTPWLERDIELLKEFYKNNIRNLFDDVDFIQDEIRPVNGKDHVVFEFVSSVKGDPNSLRNRAPVVDYRFVQYAVKDKQVYVFTFQCPARFKDHWQEAAREIMASIVFK